MLLHKIKFYTVSFLKNELYIGISEGLLIIVTLAMAIFWIIFNKSEIEPYTIITACFTGLLDLTKRLVTIPKLPKLTFEEAIAPSSKEAAFFIGATLTNLKEAINASHKSGKGLFLVIYDQEHPTNSELNYALGAFTSYELTKRLINDYFIQAVVPSTDPGVQQYIADYHMELCLLVVLNSKGKVLRKEGVYANADEGLKRVREDILK
jgi:hypothetical protein